MDEKEAAGIRYFQFSSWPQNGRLFHALFSRVGGVSAPPFASLNLSSYQADRQDWVLENQRRAYGVGGRSRELLVHANLVHGNDVAVVDRADHGSVIKEVDGLITDDKQCGLTMNYADCGSVFLYDPVREVIGLGHAGWKGAIKNLPGAMVRKMVVEFGSQPEDILAGLGASIGLCCYEVGEELVEAVGERFKDPRRWFEDRGGERPYFDLMGLNQYNLAEAGVVQIERSELCTACRTDLFFSHRAEKGVTGRFGAMISFSVVPNERG